MITAVVLISLFGKGLIDDPMVANNREIARAERQIDQSDASVSDQDHRLKTLEQRINEMEKALPK
jgi:hypothetical protein